MMDPQHLNSDWLTISGAVSGWVSLLISVWSIKLSLDTTKLTDSLVTDIRSFRKKESERVDRMLNTLTKYDKQRRK